MNAFQILKDFPPPEGYVTVGMDNCQITELTPLK